MLEREASVLLKIECSKNNTQERRPQLQSITQYSLEHTSHVSDTRDIPTPNILIEVDYLTALNSRPSGDVRD